MKIEKELYYCDLCNKEIPREEASNKRKDSRHFENIFMEVNLNYIQNSYGKYHICNNCFANEIQEFLNTFKAINQIN